MRVIRTEVYFDGNYVRRRQDKWLKSGNVTFAWIRTGETRQPVSLDLPDLSAARPISPEQVPLVLDYILRQERMQPFASEQEPLLNSSTVENILEEAVVVEQSPVETETLSSILKTGVKGSGTVALSVFVAVNGDAYLFVTLPAALLVVGASKGMSKWLEQNVPKLMNRATRKWLR